MVVAISARAGDLYLLEIDSQSSLDHIRGMIDHAYGVIDGRFLIELTAGQAGHLKQAGIGIELIAADFDHERYYRVDKLYPEIAIVPLVLKTAYSKGDSHILELNRPEIDILQRSGYMVRKITDRETPLFYNPPLVGLPALPDYPSDSLADLINQDSLYNYTTRLETFQTRFILSSGNVQARNWIKNKFQSFGYTNVSLQNFGITVDRYDYDLVDYPCYNVICYKPGSQKPDKLIVVGAHYDSINLDREDAGMTFAPGADDNATGTAAVLELARIFKNVETAYSMMFVAFSAEEWGLFGSEYLASMMNDDGSDVVLMLNFDMLGHVTYNPDVVKFYCGWADAYYDAFSAAAGRVAGLTSVNEGDICSSDDASFYDYGFSSLCSHEYDFNYNLHTDNDVSSILDFNYMNKLVRTAAAGLGVTDNSPEPVEFQILDIGDGQSLRLVIDNCQGDYTYRVAYAINWYDGLADTVDVSPGDCYFDLTGLQTGKGYPIGIIGQPSSGNPPLGMRVLIGRPNLIPSIPRDFTLVSDSSNMTLTWRPNQEIDFDHYRIIRKAGTEDWAEFEPEYFDTVLVDNDLTPYTRYSYIIFAVDNDLHQSDSSDIVSGILTTFDRGILMVEETQTGGNNPTENQQTVFYNRMFDEFDYYRQPIDTLTDTLSGGLAGQFNPIFWVDDDNTMKLLSGSLDTLEWYFGYETDFLLAGWGTIFAITGHSYFYSGDFYYDHFGISYIAQNILPDFTGATGVDGWPDLTVRNEEHYLGILPNIDIFTAAPGAEVIYTFDSYSGNPFYGNKPVGIAFDTHHGKRVILGFPLYYLTEESAQALVVRVMEYFAEETVLYGDVNGDWSVNILDVTYLINYLYRDGAQPPDMNNADPNGSCAVNILDATYLISYLYRSGPSPVAGCVE